MNKISKYLFIGLSAITAGLLIAIGVMAFTGPGANQPPSGNPSFWQLNGTSTYYSAGNVGIGTTTPTTAKLVVNGTIAASSPVNAGDVATKAYVDAAAPSYYVSFCVSTVNNWYGQYVSGGGQCPTGWTLNSNIVNASYVDSQAITDYGACWVCKKN